MLRKKKLYDERFLRNALSAQEQKEIAQSTFAIVGLGGTGGFILENLLRLGAERFVLFDSDRFELTNFNRQILAMEQSLDRLKTEIAFERAKSINPNVRIRCFGRFGQGSSKGQLTGVNILLDGVDNVQTKLEIAKAARNKKIPYVFCSANDSRGIVTTFAGYRFEKAFQLKKNGEYKTCSRIICPAAALAGTLAASQAINCLFGKPFIRAPQAQFFDLSKKEIFWRAKLG